MSTAFPTKTNPKPQTTKKSFRVLMVTGIYPTEQRPHSGTFVKTQVDSLVAAGLEVEVIHPKPGPVPLRYVTAATQVFLKTLTGRFDVVHGHYGLWCLAARMQWTTPVVAAYLGDDLLGTVTTGGGYSKKSLLVVHISRWLCHLVDAVTVKTEQMKRAASGDSIFVIPDGINFELFHPMPRAEVRATLGWDQERYYVLFGNNPQIPVKNFPLAQAAIECLRNRGLDVELVVANGFLQTTVAQYISACNAVVLPSFAEGSPNIVKEAMACNVPVVATEVGDVSELLGRTAGCSVSPYDSEAFAAALEKAFQHTEPTTGRTDIAYADSSVIAGRIIEVYAQIVSRKTREQRVHPAFE